MHEESGADERIRHIPGGPAPSREPSSAELIAAIKAHAAEGLGTGLSPVVAELLSAVNGRTAALQNVLKLVEALERSP